MLHRNARCRFYGASLFIVNSELLEAFANFVHRTLKFIEKSFDSKIPQTAIDGGMHAQIVELYKEVGHKIEEGSSKAALDAIFEFVRTANRARKISG